MPLTWYQQSQINFGLIMQGLKHPQAYRSETFSTPFNEYMDFILERGECVKEALYAQFPPKELDGALVAVATLQNLKENKDLDRIGMLVDAATYDELGDKCINMGRSFKKGERPEALSLTSDLRFINAGESLGAVRVADLDWENAAELQPSGWDVIDNTFGGIPITGPLVICGVTGTGKSFLISKLVLQFLKRYKARRAGVYTLEMPDKRYAKRSINMYPGLLNVKDRLWVSGKAKHIEDIIAEASEKEWNLVVIDSIDYLSDKEMSAAVMDRLWKAIVRMGRLLEIPIIVTAQPNREAKWRAITQFHQIYDIAWSGSAEDAAEQLWFIQHIRNEVDWVDETFPVHEDAYYIISWKQRGGYEVQRGPGAIILKDLEKRKGQKVLWSGKAYNNLIFTPGNGRGFGKGKGKLS